MAVLLGTLGLWRMPASSLLAAQFGSAVAPTAAGSTPPSAAPASTPPTSTNTAALDAAFRAFWDAESPRDAEKRAASILASGAGFEAVLARLRTGRSYAPAKSGRVEIATTDNGNPLDNVVEVPADYAPARAWPLRVNLHGGVGREAPPLGGEPARPLTNRIPSAGEIVIHPRAWSGSEWWTAGQVDNVLGLLDRVKRRFNVDESRVYATGISDGGTGVYFFGMRVASPWAACLPLNGHPSVLANPDVGADGQLYAGNLVNCPLYAVSGGRDRLYPAASVTPLIEMFRRGGVPVVHQIYPEAGHDVSWWPEERSKYEAFMASHPRVAHPARVSWETERTDRYNRFRWVVIDRLGTRGSDVQLDDVNTFAPRPSMEIPLYDRAKRSGRVDVVRDGNAFEVKSRGVQQVTLLLSPDVIDFAKPVHVTVNGRSVHDGPVKTDAATLLAWAARDNDRTMLYGAALTLTVP